MPKIDSNSTPTKDPIRKRTPYNNFMSDELKRIKTAEPGIDHKVAFKKAAANWRDSPENPKSTKFKGTPRALAA